MPVPNIFAGSTSGTTAQFDANFAYFTDAFDVANGNILIGTPTKPAATLGAGFVNVHARGANGAIVEVSTAGGAVSGGLDVGSAGVRVGARTNNPMSLIQENEEAIGIRTGGAVHFPRIGTTASASNAVLNAGASPANQLLRSTSSLRYKTDVRALPDSYRAAVMALRPVLYKSKADADDSSVDYVGLIAEEVAMHVPQLVNYTRLTENGPMVPDGMQYDRLGVLLLAELQALSARVAALEAA